MSFLLPFKSCLVRRVNFPNCIQLQYNNRVSLDLIGINGPKFSILHDCGNPFPLSGGGKLKSSNPWNSTIQTHLRAWRCCVCQAGGRVGGTCCPQLMRIIPWLTKWTIKRWYSWWKKSIEILHQLIGSSSHYLQGLIPPRWCRSSSINTMENRYTSFQCCWNGILINLPCHGDSQSSSSFITFTCVADKERVSWLIDALDWWFIYCNFLFFADLW